MIVLEELQIHLKQMLYQKRIQEFFNVRLYGKTLQISSTASGVTKVNIFDALGHNKLEQESALSSGVNSIDLQSLEAGSYLVRVRQGTKMAQTRIRIQ